MGADRRLRAQMGEVWMRNLGMQGFVVTEMR
jgi:hypothetical protein